MYEAKDFDETRYWIAKIATHLLMQGCLLISLDESSFKTHQESKKGWQFKPLKRSDDGVNKRQLLNPPSLISLPEHHRIA